MSEKPKVLVGIPTYNGQVYFDSFSTIHHSANGSAKIYIHHAQSSLIPQAFNELWITALNDREHIGITHFCMLHADVIPQQVDWLKILLEEMQRVDADVLSVVNAIKDRRKITSTAWATELGGDPKKTNYVKIEDLAGLPETFDATSSPIPGAHLLVNTGCLLIDVRKPWVENWKGFRIDANVFFDGEQWGRRVASEDWIMSVEAAELGARVFATQKVSTLHAGQGFYPNWKR